MRGVILSIIMVAMAGHASAQSALVENCYSHVFDVEPVNFSKDVIEDRRVYARLTYKALDGIEEAIGGIELAFEIWSDARPLPLYSSHIREFRSIDGGLMPGETIEGHDAHFMDERVKELARQAGELTVRFEVQGVKDADGNSLGCP